MSNIPYDLTKIRGIAFDVDGVLSPNCIPLGTDGIPRRMANIKDGYALQLAVRKGLKIVVISGAVSDGLIERFAILGIKDVYLGAGMKSEVFADWMEREGLQPEEVAFVGDDVPDLDCLKAAGLAVVPADASFDALQVAKYVSPACGGQGVARDLLEEILRAQGLWPVTDKAWGW